VLRSPTLDAELSWVKLVGALGQLATRAKWPLLGNEDANVQLQLGEKSVSEIGLAGAAHRAPHSAEELRSP